MEYKSFDVDTLLKQFEGDEEILVDMITHFISSAHNLMNSLKDSIEAQDVEKLKLNAHTLKGVMSNFYADESKKLAIDLEKCAERGVFDRTEEILHQLEAAQKSFINEVVFLKNKLEIK